MSNYVNTSRDAEDSQSPVLATKYAHTASNLVRTLARNFVFIIGVISAVIIFASLDVLNFVGYLKVVPDVLYDSMVATFSVILLAVILYQLNTVLKSKRVLSSWADTFERNSIRTGINIAMTNRSKEEAIHGVAETIAQIGEPLRNYISSKDSLYNFLDVNFKSNNNEKDINFDVLIDQDHVKNETRSIDANNSSNLKQALREYGAIVIKEVEGTVDNGIVRDFYDSLSKYTLLTKNKVGLALIIGENISEDASNTARQLENDKINYIVLIEKPMTMTQ
jgi:hypothetical protein